MKRDDYHTIVFEPGDDIASLHKAETGGGNGRLTADFIEEQEISCHERNWVLPGWSCHISDELGNVFQAGGFADEESILQWLMDNNVKCY